VQFDFLPGSNRGHRPRRKSSHLITGGKVISQQKRRNDKPQHFICTRRVIFSHPAHFMQIVFDKAIKYFITVCAMCGQVSIFMLILLVVAERISHWCSINCQPVL